MRSTGQPWDESRFYRLGAEVESAVTEEVELCATKKPDAQAAEVEQTGVEVQVTVGMPTKVAPTEPVTVTVRAEQGAGLISAEVVRHHTTSLRRSASYA